VTVVERHDSHPAPIPLLEKTKQLQNQLQALAEISWGLGLGV